jgi:hypothetical protein
VDDREGVLTAVEIDVAVVKEELTTVVACTFVATTVLESVYIDVKTDIIGVSEDKAVTVTREVERAVTTTILVLPGKIDVVVAIFVLIEDVIDGIAWVIVDKTV